jgi:FAD/FMN-containing dehydrogenase
MHGPMLAGRYQFTAKLVSLMHSEPHTALSNWSGSVRLRPARVVHPESEQEICDLVRHADVRGGTVRVVGARHSSSSILETADTLICMDRLSGLRPQGEPSIAGRLAAEEASRSEVWARAGTPLKELGRSLLKERLGLQNYGDVDVQTIAGAIGTGTHGSGRRLQNLATMLIGARLVDGTGSVKEFSIERDPDVIRALRVSLGSVGILTSVRIAVVEAYRLQRSEWCTTFDRAAASFDEVADRCRNADFYWYPRSDEVKVRTLDEPGRVPDSIPGMRLLAEETGWAADVLPRQRVLRFEEMEYAMPAEAGLACMREVRDRVKAKHRRVVGWRVLYRLIAADDAYLSTAHGHDVVTISLHHNAGLPYHEYFSDIEPIFRAHGGRPHWAKKHSLTGETLRDLYPQWDQFQAVRRELDPHGVFLSEGMCKLFDIRKST